MVQITPMVDMAAPETTATTSESSPPQHDPPSKVTGGGSLLATGNFADFVIVCGEKEWKEATSGRINLSCDDEDARNELITYLYTNKYPDTSALEHTATRAMLHLNIHILADKYNLPEVVTLAAESFMNIVEDHSSTPVFGPLLIAVMEDTPPHSTRRKSCFDVVKHDVEDLMSGHRQDEEGFNSLSDAFLRCPNITLELLTAIVLKGEPATRTADRRSAMPAQTTSTNAWGKSYSEKR
ncbi:hypothetical protein LTR95_013351, partial [Oleoguttula sp. CCFEE 5521]